MNIVLDTGTQDPDDILTLCYLADKGLKAVTLWPGSLWQVGLVKTILRELGLNIPVGGNCEHAKKSSVSPFYSKVFNYKPEREDALAKDIIRQYKDDIILTCECPFNLDGVHIKNWYAQGGFAGDNVVDEVDRLEKFKGKLYCPSFNFSHANLIKRLIADSDKRTFVSKNVCHGVSYNKLTHEKTKEGMIKKIMGVYLQEHEEKMFHDLLAASVIFDRDICKFKEVDMYHKNPKPGVDNGGWGCNEKLGTNTFISVSVDKERFWKTLEV